MDDDNKTVKDKLEKSEVREKELRTALKDMDRKVSDIESQVCLYKKNDSKKN